MSKLPKGWKPYYKFEATGFNKGVVEKEYLCTHGIGHSNGIHGCDGCCEQIEDIAQRGGIMKSNCCGADVTVPTSDEGTSCYVCLECNRACDAAAPPQETTKRKKQESYDVPEPDFIEDDFI